MGKTQVSIGDDTPTGEPENGPQGPYITDEDDGTRNRARNNKTGKKSPDSKKKEDSDQRRPPDDQLPSRTETKITEKSDLGSDR
jgi:hypothetical protein